MGDLIAHLIAFVAQIWSADAKIRDSSVVGESEMERRSRRLIARLFGAVIALLLLTGIVWLWLTGHL